MTVNDRRVSDFFDSLLSSRKVADSLTPPAVPAGFRQTTGLYSQGPGRRTWGRAEQFNPS